MSYLILVDQAEDGFCETQGWVEVCPAVDTEDKARDALAEFCVDEDGEMGYRPTGPAQQVLLRVDNPDQEWEEQRWVPAEDGADKAVLFWEVIVA